MIKRYRKYHPVQVEAVMQDGEVRIRNAYVTENRSCEAGDPDWPRERLIKMATLDMIRWDETYAKHSPGISLRVSK